MDDGGHRESRRQRMDYYKGGQSPWNMMPQYQMKEQIFMNTKISALLAERDAAIEERDRALSEKREAIADRDLAIQQRDTAIAERDNALRERDNAIAALQFQESTMSAALGSGSQRGTKRINHHSDHYPRNMQSTQSMRELQIIEAFPITAISSEDAKSHLLKRTKVKKGISTKGTRSSKKAKKVGEDLNRHVTTDGSKAEWEAQDLSCINEINFDESTMPIPVCTCTGVARQCYKWGNGGWQSSCCTTSLSVYPLPQIPNKRHARMGGRKMSGSVFGRLLTRVAAAGHDLSIPLDLKNYWAKHGTNRYITIK
ncbi:hypothetical protein M9H77_13609 [Catharanthus roseus]|uniref:Uncharacterized protein n=1 Tax=Catharanthus roseus TaxID=4058 RepID=A0ACC0BKU6_CATRO|nr:hypothetical protein M9H77_13609 [Catharanthus roseus]